MRNNPKLIYNNPSPFKSVLYHVNNFQDTVICLKDKLYICNSIAIMKIIDSPKQLLKKYNLHLTRCRVEVLEYFSSRQNAISIPELEDQFTSFDRVTLYRTVRVFEQKGIIHSISDESNVTKYSLCQDTCKPGNHQHDHLHFKCTSCGNLECIDVKLSEPPLIPGYIVNEMQTIVSGICKNCNKN